MEIKYELKLKKQTKISSKEDVAKLVGSKGIQMFYNLIRLGPRVIVRGAFQLLRVNLATRLLSALFLIFFDGLSFVRGRISLKQFLINAGLALMLLVGGTFGWYVGSGAIQLVFLENAALGILAGLLGAGAFGTVFGNLWEKAAKRFVKDDAASMLPILNDSFNELVGEYGLSPEESKRLMEEIEIDKKMIQHLYASPGKDVASRELLIKFFEAPKSRD